MLSKIVVIVGLNKYDGEHDSLVTRMPDRPPFAAVVQMKLNRTLTHSNAKTSIKAQQS